MATVMVMFARFSFFFRHGVQAKAFPGGCSGPRLIPTLRRKVVFDFFLSFFLFVSNMMHVQLVTKMFSSVYYYSHSKRGAVIKWRSGWRFRFSLHLPSLSSGYVSSFFPRRLRGS